MELPELLKLLKNYNQNQIVVSGPQRSGTTIATKIIAQELGYPPIFEEGFEITDLQKCLEFYTTTQRFVMQAPAMSAYLNHFPGAVVFMIRNVYEIINSEKRIQWSQENREKATYFLQNDRRCISVIKYDIWDEYQKHLPNRFELEYHSLEGHPLWIDTDKRRHFHSRQISL